jgi:two-component system OmpR family sensor kinase
VLHRARGRPRSLYKRLAAGFLAVTVLAVVVADLGSAWFLKRELQSRSDAQVVYALKVRVEAMRSHDVFADAQGPCVAALFEADGASLKQSAGAEIPGARLSLSPVQLERYAASGAPVSMANGGFRAAVARLPNGRYIVSAVSMASAHKTVRGLLAIEGLVSLPLVAAVVLGTLWFCRRALRPVHDVTRTAFRVVRSSAPESDLSHRVESTYSSSEARCMADIFNAMLDRIETEFHGRRKAEGELRHFVAAASHELRTPLTTISGYAQLARLGALADPLELDQAMERVHEEAGRMAELVDELLLLARLDQGRPLESTQVDLAELCAEVVADARVRYPHRDIRYTEPGAAQTVLGDPHRLRQVIINLVCNYATHTPPETGLEVRLAREGCQEVIDVIDDGPGIPEELRGRVFERFFQARPRTGEARSGSGLGLSIVAAIVSAHGGSVTMEPSERGAWFRVRVPVEGPVPGGARGEGPRSGLAAAKRQREDADEEYGARQAGVARGRSADAGG